jgi:hypothetical protein
MSHKLILLVVFVALACLELYSLFPGQAERYITPFPFDKQVINVQAYIDYIGTRLCVILLIFALWQYNEQMFWFFILAIGYLIDYLLIYNNPFAHIYIFDFRTPLSYTMFMILSAGFVILKAWLYPNT